MNKFKRPVDPHRVTFTELAKNCFVPETTLRRKLTKAGINIPHTGFSKSTASNIRQLVHAQGCYSGWMMVSEFASESEQVRNAQQMADKFRKQIKTLTAKINNNQKPHLNR